MTFLTRSAGRVVAAIALTTCLCGPAATQSTGFLGAYGQPGMANDDARMNEAALSNGIGGAAVPSYDSRDGASPPRYAPDAIEDRRSTTASRRPTMDDQDRDPNAELMRVPLRQPSEFERYVKLVVGEPLERFGSNLLVPSARGFTAPPTTNVPPDYQLNPGDEIILGLTGSIQASDLRLTLDPEGRVFVPRVGAIMLGGVPYRDIRATIARRVSAQYANFQVAVSIGQLHGITVYVTGFAERPGSYTISSLSTLVTAVLAAGGPAPGGSFRSLQVRREGRLVSSFDLYDLLLKGDKSADISLQNDDVIYVAPTGPQVAVAGSVNLPAIYEAKPDETLRDMLAYAGGLNTVADESRALRFDPKNSETQGWRQLSLAQAQAMRVERGEIIQILSSVGLARPLGSQSVLVSVSGEVARPGRFFLPPNARLADAIGQAGGLTESAFPRATVFTREGVRTVQADNNRRAIQEAELLLTAEPIISGARGQQASTSPLPAIRAVVSSLKTIEPNGRLIFAGGRDSLPSDFTLQHGDAIYVPPRPVTIGVFGFVANPSMFQFAGGGTIGDYVRRAGGANVIGDRSKTYVIRADGSLLGSTGGLFGRSVLGSRAEPGDMIFVPVDADRGVFWAKLRDITSTLFAGAVGALAITTAAK